MRTCTVRFTERKFSSPISVFPPFPAAFTSLLRLHDRRFLGRRVIRSTAESPLSATGMAPRSSVERVRDRATGLDKFVLHEARGSSAEVYLYGGQVTFWKNNFGEQQLFVSSKASFKPPIAIRGGIQICFPQLGNHGVLEQHGFARNRLWSVDESPPAATPFDCHIDLILKQSQEDLKIWPHSYELRLQVALSPRGDLVLTSRIKNNGADGKPLQFTFAYHTYFSVSDISEVRIEGLDTLDYLDNLHSKIRCTEQGDAVVFESEVDRVYLSAPPKIVIIDHEKKRTFVIRKHELPDVVVWNPWDKKAKLMPDFGDEEYKCMLCVGAARIEKPITLRPGEEWQGRQEISSVPSSYSSGQLDPEIIRQMRQI